MSNVISMPVIANCEWKTISAHTTWVEYAGFTFPNGWAAEVWKNPGSDPRGAPSSYTVRVLNHEGTVVNNTEFGEPRTKLEEMAANFAIREIMELDCHGRTRDYFDERPER